VTALLATADALPLQPPGAAELQTLLAEHARWMGAATAAAEGTAAGAAPHPSKPTREALDSLLGARSSRVFTDATPLVEQLTAAAARAEAWSAACCEVVHPGGAATAEAATASGRLGAELAAAIALLSASLDPLRLSVADPNGKEARKEERAAAAAEAAANPVATAKRKRNMTSKAADAGISLDGDDWSPAPPSRPPPRLPPPVQDRKGRGGRVCVCQITAWTAAKEKEFMLECDQPECEERYHARCVGLSVNAARNLRHYTCPLCAAARSSQPLKLPPRSPAGPTPTVDELQALVDAVDATGVEVKEAAALRTLVAELQHWRRVARATLYAVEAAEAQRRPAAAPREAPVDPEGAQAYTEVEAWLLEALVGAPPHQSTAPLRRLLKAVYASQIDVSSEWTALKRAVVAIPWRAKATTTLWGISLKPDVKTLGRLRREATALGLVPRSHQQADDDGAGEEAEMEVGEAAVPATVTTMDAVTAAVVEREETVRGWHERASAAVADPSVPMEAVQALQAEGEQLVEVAAVATQLEALAERATLYCVCRLPYDEGRDMIACDTCDDWFHYECVRMVPCDTLTTYMCESCCGQHGQVRVCVCLFRLLVGRDRDVSRASTHPRTLTCFPLSRDLLDAWASLHTSHESCTERNAASSLAQVYRPNGEPAAEPGMADMLGPMDDDFGMDPAAAGVDANGGAPVSTEAAAAAALPPALPLPAMGSLEQMLSNSFAPPAAAATTPAAHVGLDPPPASTAPASAPMAMDVLPPPATLPAPVATTESVAPPPLPASEAPTAVGLDTPPAPTAPAPAPMAMDAPPPTVSVREAQPPPQLADDALQPMAVDAPAASQALALPAAATSADAPPPGQDS